MAAVEILPPENESVGTLVTFTRTDIGIPG